MENKTDFLYKFLKQYGFIMQNSEIYGGLKNTWDFGLLGIKIKENIKSLWKKIYFHNDPINFYIETSILMHPQTWVNSGHKKYFQDYYRECKNCHHRIKINSLNSPNKIKKELECDICKKNCEFTPIKKFNLMFSLKNKIITKKEIYLRPETAQGIFVNYMNLTRTIGQKIPFGIGQIGKSFRNEITVKKFLFKMYEFEQMELEFFTKKTKTREWMSYWRKKCINFLKQLNLKLEENIFWKKCPKNELPHYAIENYDIEFTFPFGKNEIVSICNRGSYDLKNHFFKPINFNETTREEFPSIIETSIGVERTMLATIYTAFKQNKRIILKLPPLISPYFIAILPLIEKFSFLAKKIFQDLKNLPFSIVYENKGSIGKRYYKQDAIGTPFCIVIDEKSYKKEASVSIRERDTSNNSKRIKISELKNYFKELFESLVSQSIK